MAEVVLDASAVIAYLLNEPGAELVRALLPGAMISAVNLAEVVAMAIDRGVRPELAQRSVDHLLLAVMPLDHPLAIRTGTLRAITAHCGLSLGDRACIALAEREGVPALTADRAWSALDIGVEIRLIR